MSDVEDAGYPFTLVQFILRGRKKPCKEVDIVPSQWIKWDETRKKCVVKFMPTPYSEDDITLLQGLIKSSADPPEDWPSYSVCLVGNARTYEEGLRKLDTLSVKAHAFSAIDSNASPSAMQKDLEKKIKQKKLQVDAEKVQSILHRAVEAGVPKKMDTTNVEPFKIVRNQVSPLTPKRNKYLEVNYQIEKENEMTYSQPSFSLSCKTSRSDYSSPRSIKKQKKGHQLNNNKSEGENEILCQAPSISRKCLTKTCFSSSNTMNDNATLPRKEFVIAASNVENNNNVAVVMEDPSLRILESLNLNVEQIKNDLLEIKRNQRNILDNLYSNNIQNVERKIDINIVDFPHKYDVELPLKNVEDFQNFDRALSENKVLLLDFTNFIRAHMHIDKSITKSITDLLKMLISREIAIQYTAVKHIPGKHVLKTTALSICMRDVIIERRRMHGLNTTDKEYFNALSVILSNSKDWDGHRSKRRQTDRQQGDDENEVDGFNGEENDDTSEGRLDDNSSSEEA